MNKIWVLTEHLGGGSDVLAVGVSPELALEGVNLDGWHLVHESPTEQAWVPEPVPSKQKDAKGNTILHQPGGRLLLKRMPLREAPAGEHSE